MAAAVDFEEDLTCSICLEIYTDPVILKCLHTLCESCKDQQAKGTVIECPECRENTAMKDVRKDFKTTRLIEKFYGRNTKQQIENQCQICHEHKSDWECLDCNKILCKKCKKHHTEIPLCASHKFVAIKENNTKTKRRLEALLSDYEKELGSMNTKLNTFRKATNNTQTLQKKIEQDIDRSEADLIDPVKRHHTKIRSELKGKVRNELDTLEGQKRKLKAVASIVNKDMSSLKAEIENINPKNDCQKKLRHLHSQRKDNLQKYLSDANALDAPRIPLRVSLSVLNTYDQVLDKIALGIQESVYKSKCSLFTTCMSNPVDTNHIAVKVYCLSGEIWIASADGNIGVYGKDGTFKRDLSVYNESDEYFNMPFAVETLTEGEDCGIIAGCWGFQGRHTPRRRSSKIGLVQITHDGLISKVICEKFYYSIDWNDKKLYGLTSDSRNVDIFMKSDSEWKLINSVSLQQNLEYTSLCVDSNRLVLCVDNKSEIHVMSHGQDTLEKITFSGPEVRACASHKTISLCCSGSQILALQEGNILEVLHQTSQEITSVQDMSVDNTGTIWLIGEKNQKNILLKVGKIDL